LILSLLDITPLPYDTNGYITFGSFNTIEKINPYTVYLWSKALKAVPSSKLLIYRTQLKDIDINRFKRQFKENGIDEARLIFDNKEMPINHKQAYLKCDIALDPSPFSGLTVTMEQALMGIPTITLLGETISSRGAAQINFALKLESLIAETEDDYIKIVSGIEEHINEFRWLRNNLRTIATHCDFCNGFKKYTKEIEEAYNIIWQKFCQK